MSLLFNDRSNGYESIAGDFIAHRTNSHFGVQTVRNWAKALPRSATVLDLGCGHGIPISATLVEAGAAVFGIDASPSLIAAFRARFPDAPTECNVAEESTFFGRSFDAVIAWGVIFLLTPTAQEQLIAKVSSALNPGGSFLFTAPAQVCEWSDNLTGRKSVSLGAEVYRQLVRAAGMTVVDETEDEGENHYYMVRKASVAEGAV